MAVQYRICGGSKFEMGGDEEEFTEDGPLAKYLSAWLDKLSLDDCTHKGLELLGPIDHSGNLLPGNVNYIHPLTKRNNEAFASFMKKHNEKIREKFIKCARFYSDKEHKRETEGEIKINQDRQVAIHLELKCLKETSHQFPGIEKRIEELELELKSNQERQLILYVRLGKLKQSMSTIDISKFNIREPQYTTLECSVEFLGPDNGDSGEVVK